MKIKKFYENVSGSIMDRGGHDFDKRRVSIMLEFTKDLKIKKILDVGCIPEMTKLFTDNLNCSTVGINISKNVIGESKYKKIKFIVKDFNKYKTNKKFDMIILGEFIEHVFDVDKFMIKIKKHLKPGGYLLISAPNLASLFNRISILLGWQPYSMNPSRSLLLNPMTKYDFYNGHISLFTYSALIKFLKKNGFKIIKTRGTYVGHKNERIARKLLRKLICKKTSFAEDIIVLAQLINK